MQKLKTLLAYAGSWTCYGAGHITSKLFEIVEWQWVFLLYNWFMTISVDINDKFNLDIWSTVTNDEDDE